MQVTRAQRIKLQAGNKKGGENVMFTKVEYQLRLPFVIYADFEIVLCKQDSCGPCGSCINVKCSDGQYFEPSQVNMGDDTAENFLDQILATATICRQHLTNKIPMK